MATSTKRRIEGVRHSLLQTRKAQEMAFNGAEWDHAQAFIEKFEQELIELGRQQPKRTKGFIALVINLLIG